MSQHGWILESIHIHLDDILEKAESAREKNTTPGFTFSGDNVGMGCRGMREPSGLKIVYLSIDLCHVGMCNQKLIACLLRFMQNFVFKFHYQRKM